jgi:intein/homing endonuclease
MPTSLPYYTTCAPIILGCTLYTNSNYTGYAPAGYYSDGIKIYQVTGSLGQVTNITNCTTTTTTVPCGNCCFVGNTLIALSDGSLLAIEKIKKGHEVLSFNEASGKVESNSVLAVRTKMANKLVRYILSNSVIIESTDDHPFYVNGYNIASFNPLVTTEKYNFEIDIDQIQVGDVLNLQDGGEVVIEYIEVDEDVHERVYTFEVENNHNYFANGVLVHNKTFGQICCFNTVTSQYAVINNAGDPGHSGCCCLGANWVAAPPEDCNLGGSEI